MGEIGVAVVVARHAGDAPTLEALRAHARGRLASYKLPEAIVHTADLPRTAMEKIDRSALGALVSKTGPDSGSEPRSGAGSGSESPTPPHPR
jgi:acyl-CoA synthetase (AMP-forming)/AMP-acid ligase II